VLTWTLLVQKHMQKCEVCYSGKTCYLALQVFQYSSLFCTSYAIVIQVVCSMALIEKRATVNFGHMEDCTPWVSLQTRCWYMKEWYLEFNLEMLIISNHKWMVNVLLMWGWPVVRYRPMHIKQVSSLLEYLCLSFSPFLRIIASVESRAFVNIL
jgi:hypothetical protein